jgi:hypothetical protein
METLPIDLSGLVAIVMGSLLVLIPVLGLALRWAAKPLAEALAASKGPAARSVDLDGLKMRIEALEHEVHQLAPGAEVRALPPPVRGGTVRT